ncbi:hypothetical protein T4D_9021 [Trichinella pseudospiralis]|uniref:Uncharacterized protein n=1 Tax=Trichinella pseudospiralis TaxID=6337 RepID=A0A0V1FUH5_TRIPS|nr:hypothetical protein T4D_9021 [Trichinella pseudospiralis]
MRGKQNIKKLVTCIKVSLTASAARYQLSNDTRISLCVNMRTLSKLASRPNEMTNKPKKPSTITDSALYLSYGQSFTVDAAPPPVAPPVPLPPPTATPVPPCPPPPCSALLALAPLLTLAPATTAAAAAALPPPLATATPLAPALTLTLLLALAAMLALLPPRLPLPAPPPAAAAVTTIRVGVGGVKETMITMMNTRITSGLRKLMKKSRQSETEFIYLEFFTHCSLTAHSLENEIKRIQPTCQIRPTFNCCCMFIGNIKKK